MRLPKITFEEARDPRHPRTNPYMTVYGFYNCWAFYERSTRQIRIVRQHNLVRTMYLLMHELGHWVIDTIWDKNDKKRLRMQRKYDIIDNIIFDWNKNDG